MPANSQYRLHKLPCLKMVLWMALLWIPGEAYSQRAPIFHLGVDDGLVQSQITCLAQDHKGNLWAGTLGGISRYDGTYFTNYTERNGLKSNYVWSIGADAHDNIWIGTSGYLTCFNGRTYRHYPLPEASETLADRASQQIVFQNDSVFWLVGGVLFVVDKDKLSRRLLPGTNGHIYAVKAGEKGIWIGADSFLLHQAGGRTDTLYCRKEDTEPALGIRSIYVQNDRSVWVLTTKGIFWMNDKRASLCNARCVEGGSTVSPGCFTRDATGALWLGTSRGVLKVVDTFVSRYHRQNGLSDNAFTTAFTDASGNAWLGSDGQGIYRVANTRFTLLDEAMGLASSQITAIAQGPGDSLYFGGYEGGLSCYSDGKILPVHFPFSPEPGITSLVYGNDKLWLGTRDRGLWTYDGEDFVPFRSKSGRLPSSFVTRLYKAADNRIWVGTINGVSLISGDSILNLDLGNKPVNSFCQIGKDSMLIATDGLFISQNGACTPFQTHTAIDSVQVQCLYTDGDNLWLGSSDYGIFRYELRTHRLTMINTSNGLRSDFIYNLIGDQEGNIWAGTGYGIHKICITGSDKVKVAFYGKAQGVVGMESNSNAVLKTRAGDIWFGTTNGALHYQPLAGHPHDVPPRLVLTSVKLANQLAISADYYRYSDSWYDIPYGLKLPANLNGLTFSFRAIYMDGAQQLRYRYRMEGLETPWSQWSGITSVSFSALPPGSYLLHLQVMGTDETTYPELTYPFEIITPFQKSNWFRWCILGACLLTGVVLQYMAGRGRQKRMQLLARLRTEEQAKIRLRTAEDFHDEVGNRLTRINVLANVLKNKSNLNEEGMKILEQIKDNTAQLYSGTQDILWSLKPTNDNLYEILERIHHFGNELLNETDIQFIFHPADESWRGYRLPMDMSRNLIMIFKEALNNCVKYAQAKRISVEISLKNRGLLQIIMKDDGLGFDVHTIQKGNGLNNMQVRAGRLNGRLYVDSRPGKGTVISLTFKIPQAPR